MSDNPKHVCIACAIDRRIKIDSLGIVYEPCESCGGAGPCYRVAVTENDLPIWQGETLTEQNARLKARIAQLESQLAAMQ